MAIECVPLIVNDGMVFPWHNIIPDYHAFSIHLSKRQVPQIVSMLRNMTNGTIGELRANIRQYKRGFIWFRPRGLAYEYTLAALGERVGSYLRLPNLEARGREAEERRGSASSRRWRVARKTKRGRRKYPYPYRKPRCLDQHAVAVNRSMQRGDQERDARTHEMYT
eukprot:6260003-Prymnesium_polylepis.1